MEENKQNNFNNIETSPESPIINYYSYINPHISQNNSEMCNHNRINFIQIPNQTISNKNNHDNKSNKSDNLINNSPKGNNTQDKNNDKLKEKNDNLKKEKEIININNTNINNSKEQKKYINSKNNNKKIRSIKPEDLIPTSINGRTILRINPFLYENGSYEFLSSNIYILLKDQLGCKFLQEKLETDPINAVCYFYPALLPNLIYLIKDSFANYFIQKICFFLNVEQIENILNILTPEFLDICCDIHGTRVIQGIMNYLHTEKLRILFFKIIKPIFISLINDKNGIYIIYKFINEFIEFLNEINNIIEDNFLNLATNKRGCFFTQNYLIMLRNNKKDNFKQSIIDQILNNCLVLIIDKAGNYLIQCLLTLGDDKIISEIIKKILNNISFYSKHKYSTYVIEKLFYYSNPNDKNKIITKLSSPEIMSDLVFDPQGNYIILKALMIADIENRKIMFNFINNLESKIKLSPYGNNFLNKVYTYINKCNYKDFENNNKNKIRK
jgi:hypothetical protein